MLTYLINTKPCFKLMYEYSCTVYDLIILLISFGYIINSTAIFVVVIILLRLLQWTPVHVFPGHPTMTTVFFVEN